MAVVLAAGALAWRLICLHYAEQMMLHSITTMQQHQQADIRLQMQRIQAQAAAQRTQYLVEAERQRQARQLLPNQRCIGGTVVEVNGSSYTQVAGAGGHPAACAGRYRTL